MAKQISVAIIDADEESRQSTKALLKAMPQVNIAGEAIDSTRGYDLVKEFRPAIVILDLFPTADYVLKLAEKITQNFPQTSLFVTSSEVSPQTMMKAMRAGAREFLSKPIGREELTNAITNFIHRENQKMAEGSHGGKILTVFGAKGGVGTTTIATNLAVNLAEQTQKSVILVDLNLQFGNAALFLNIQPEYSIVDVVKHIADLDPQLLKEALPKHASGVCLLTGPSRMEEAEFITGPHLDQILTLLRSIFEFIIIDTHTVFNDLMFRVWDASDAIVAVFIADVPTIYNTRRCLDIFQKTGYGQDKVFLLMNRHGANNGIAFEDLEKSINYPVFWKVPNQDYTTAVNAINQGIPLSTFNRRSKISLSFKELAEHFNRTLFMPPSGRRHGEAKSGQKKGLIKKFFSNF
jgi:pilus assembly protein CpaE